MKYIIINNCQICNKRLKKFINLGKQPLCDDLLKNAKKNIFYKLEVKVCNNCLTAYQKFNINKKKLFPKKYHYRSANTMDVILGMKDLVEKVKSKTGSLKKKIVLDIGCNDGSLLDIFKKYGAVTKGIEPTGAYKEAKKKGHDIYNVFFDENISKKLRKKFDKIDIITFTNVFAHIENFKSLINSLKHLISDKTLVVIENHYFREVVKKNQFDTFYHEHPRTYSLNSFKHISKLLNLKIIDFNFVKRYNGNIRVFLKKSKKHSSKLNSELNKEKKLISGYSSFQKKIEKWKRHKKKELSLLNEKYGPIPAKAFPGRASILLNLLDLDSKYIEKIYEKNHSLKIGYYAPGTNIKIVREKELKKNINKKKVIINLAWHISKEINRYLKKEFGFNGKVIDIISKKDFR